MSDDEAAREDLVEEEPKGKPRKAFEVKKWNAVALWAWDIVVDNCAICRNHIMDLCIECQANQASATSDGMFQSFLNLRRRVHSCLGNL